MVFPKIKKGGMGIGGSAGKGILYEKGIKSGYIKVKQLTVGFQLGIQAFSEVIFFQNKETLENFKKGKVKLSAQASAILIKKGIAKNSIFKNGMAVFVKPIKGVMYEATLGGQKFSYLPIL